MAYELNKQYHFVPNAGANSNNPKFPCLNIYGNDQVSKNRNVNIYEYTNGAKSQIWMIQNFSGGQKIVSGLSENNSPAYVLNYSRVSGNIGNCDIYINDATTANNLDTCIMLEAYNALNNIYFIRLLNKETPTTPYKYLTASGDDNNNNVYWANQNFNNNLQFWKLIEINSQSDQMTNTVAVTGYTKYKAGSTLYSYNTGKPSAAIKLKNSNASLSNTETDVKVLSVKESYNQRNIAITPSLSRQCYTCAIANMVSFLTGVDVCPNWLNYDTYGFKNFNKIVNAKIISHAISGLTNLQIMKIVATQIDEGNPVLIHCAGYNSEHWVLVYGYKKAFLNKTVMSTASEIYDVFSNFHVKDSIIIGNESKTSLVGTDTNLASSMAISLRGTTLPKELNLTINDLRYVKLNY